ncbi:hypothetical protein B4U78_005525 [Microbacterium esteraromaticum]|nr:hypothetical protein B4U78_005525 [Microbacterium esteraromaticum]
MDETAALTPGAHRGIRMLDGQESAYPGELITDGELRGVRVDVAGVPEALWMFSGAEHVAGVRDVLRRRDGHDALLPWCAERVEVLLGRRAAASAPLTAGEAVTLVGSMLRGIVEVGDRRLEGQWWLTDEARPLFAPGEGVDCIASAVALIERLREIGVDRAMDRLLADILGGMGDLRVVQRSVERWERELTELAAPRPLARDVFAPERVSAIEAHRSRLPDDIDALAEQPTLLRRLRTRATEAAEPLRRLAAKRMPARHPAAALQPRGGARAGRGRMALVGGAAAAVVLLGGLMWPSPDEGSAAIESSVVETPAAPSADTRAGTDAPTATDARESAESAPDAVADGSIEHRATELLASLAGCADAGDAACAQAVVAGAGALVQERLAGTDGKRTVSAVEDYGDVSVLRLGPSGERGEQMLVLVRQEDGWLVRDVYDVADQPSDVG